MSLIEDYLRAVALLLSRAQRDDITAELRDLILSRIEAREAERGRPLTDDETEAVLREVGHPLVVAAGYREGPQHVVGPTLFPYWVFAVKVAVTIQAAIALIVFLIRALTQGNVVRAFDQALASAVTGALLLIGVATVLAWAVERRAVRIGYLDRWRVRDLRGLEFASWDWRALSERWGLAGAWTGSVRNGAAGGGPSSVAGRALGMIAWATVLLLWWTGLLHFALARDAVELRAIGLEPGVLAMVDWSEVRARLFWPVLAYCAALLVQGTLLLARPRAVWLQGAFDLALGAAVLGLAVWFWVASPIAAEVRVDSAAQFALRMRETFDHGPPFALAPLLTLALLLTGFGGLCRMLRGAWELIAGASHRNGALPPSAAAQPS